MTNSIIQLRQETGTDEVTKSFGYGYVVQKDNKGKSFRFSVSNHLDPNKKYKFRYVAKCRAGFLTIVDTNYDMTIKELMYRFGGFVENIQVWKEYENGKGNWIGVLSTKGKKFYSVDKSILECLTVGHMYHCWKKMVDYDLWKRMNTKSHASLAYVYNEDVTEVAS
jgi:hypothetical protein